MPLLKKKIYPLTPSPRNLKANEELFVIPETKECFRNYDEYIKKVFLYSSQHWSCQYTGKSGLTYKDALQSEKKALNELTGFPDCYKKAVLKCIHKCEGNFKDIVEKCIKFLSTHFFLNENVLVLTAKTGKKSPGLITEVLDSITKTNALSSESEKENEGINRKENKVSEWKYSVQLSESDVTFTDISPSEIKRKTKLPSKELLKIFVKYSAERVPIDGKDVWLVKDELVEKYNLPVVPKPIVAVKDQKTPLRSPLNTISGQNKSNTSTPKQRTKKTSPKNVKDPSQRTLKFFVQTQATNTVNKQSPNKVDYCEKVKGSSVVADLKICLTPKNKVEEVIQKSSEKSQSDDQKTEISGSIGNDCKIVDQTVRTLFDVQQKDVTEDIHKVDEIKKNQITIEDADEGDFILKKQNVKSGEAIESKELVETNLEKELEDKEDKTTVEEKEKSCSSEPDNVQKTKKHDNTELMHAGITLHDEFNENEMKIVEKNALKKQKTLSQMFKLKNSKKIQDLKGNKLTSVNTLPRKQSTEDLVGTLDGKLNDTTDFKKEPSKTLKIPSLRTGLENVHLSLPSPKVVVVPEQLRGYYGDILMITEFVHVYWDFLGLEKDGKFRPDELVSALINKGGKAEVFIHILIGFLHVLLTDLGQQNSSKQFSDLNIYLLDMTVSESVVGELTRLYLRHCLNNRHLLRNQTKNKSISQELPQNILVDLSKKDIFDLSGEQKLKILLFMFSRILACDVFYSNYQELYEKRRQTWLKKIDLETEIRQICLEQKKLNEINNPQKEIDKFLESNVNSEEKVVEKEQDGCEEGLNDMNNKENSLEENNIETSESHRKLGEDCTNSKLTKRQEMMERSKTEKEKMDEMRRLSEQLYEKKQKVERLKETINQMKGGHRLKSLGIDRNNSRYWLLHSHPKTLLVEKIKSGNGGETADEIPNNIQTDPLSSNGLWFYYNTRAEINQLMASLQIHDDRECALKSELKAVKRHTKMLHFEKRETDLLKSPPEEETDNLGKLKAEMCDLAIRVTEGNIGTMKDIDTWIGNVKSRSSLVELVTLALELASVVKSKSLWKKLYDREAWLMEDWVEAVKDSKTSSRLRFCIAVLDYCIMWDTCTLYLKCKICRRGAGLMTVCDNCRKGFHIYCLRPALDEVPDEEWLCPVCKPVGQRITRRSAKTENSKSIKGGWVNHEDSMQGENDDYCDVCGGDGELICCDNCPKVYHKECHDPPLRNIPRGVWECCSCQGRRPTAEKRNLCIDEYSDLETSYDEGSEDSSYSEFEFEDSAAVERAERAKRRELAREKEETKNERKSKRKGKRSPSVQEDDDIEQDESENSSPIEKRQRLSTRIKTTLRNEESKGRCSRKRKCSSSEEECLVAKRKPRQNSELKRSEELLKDLTHHEDSWPFVEAVDISEVPDYLEVVSCPMDFGTIRRKLNTFDYNSYEECIDDIKLIFSNSQLYNVDTSDHGLAGISLEAYFKEILPSYFPKYKLKKQESQTSSRSKQRKRRS